MVLLKNSIHFTGVSCNVSYLFYFQTLLIASLQEHLQSYDENVKRLASEEARKQFMSFVEVNAENILPDEEGEIVKKKKKKKKYKIKHRERVRGKRRRCQIIDSDKEDDGESGSDGSEDDLDNDDKNDPDAEGTKILLITSIPIFIENKFDCVSFNVM